MRTGFLALIAASATTPLLVTGCGSSALSGDSGESGVIAFPIGTYTNCAQGEHNPDGNVFLKVAGFESDDAVLTLTQSANTVTATYLDQNHLTSSLRFSATTSTSATLAEAGEVNAGFSVLCVLGPGNEGAYPARMTVTAGALTYVAGAVFVTVTGGLQGDAGACGTQSLPKASFWLLCQDRQGGAVPSVDARGPPPAPKLPVGRYACSSQVEAYERVNGIGEYSAGGGSGTLTLTQDGAEVTAQYRDDSSLAGTLHLVATTSTTANAAAGQTLMTPCTVPIGTGSGPSKTPETLPITAGSLTISDSTLFLSFAGTMAAGSSCPGAQVAGSVICSR
jgi:hypothetical protein